MTDLGNLGGSLSQAYAINDAGEVVGYSNTTGDADRHAFLWTSKGKTQDLNKLIPPHTGWDLQSADFISDDGKIAGGGIIGGGDTLSFSSQWTNKRAGRLTDRELRDDDVHEEARIRTVPNTKG